MRVGILEAWSARQRMPTACPMCGSPRIRFSRRRYENLLATLIGVRPAKCLACGVYFAVVGKAVAAHRPLSEFELPFEPSEATDEPALGSGEIQPQAGARLPALKCPKCGDRSARPAHLGMEASVFRLDARVLYRCTSCNASFNRISPLRFLAILLILSSVLGAAAYVMNSMRFGRRGESSPMIQRNQVPKLPPPVFNKRL